MLEEIIPVLKPKQRSKLLAAERKIEGLPDIDSKISFLPFVNYLKSKRQSVSETGERFYNYLINKFEAEPELLNTAADIHIEDEYEKLLELLSSSLFPVVSDQKKNSFALATPYNFEVFYFSDSFRKLFIDKEEKHLLLPTEMSMEQLKAIECSMIYDHVLEKFYGIKLNDNPELIYPVVDEETGMKKYYRIRYDRRFIDIKPKGKIPPIQDCAVCLNTFRILDLEKQLATMPLDLFKIEGFAVWIAEDVTATESIEAIKKILLRQDECDTGIINEMKMAVKTLIGLNEIEVGLMPFVKINGRFVLDDEYSRHSILGKHWKSNNLDDTATFRFVMDFITEHPEPTPISNFTEGMFGFAPHLKPVYEAGGRSFIYYPMQNSDGFLGILEVSSPVPHLLTHEVMSRLEPAIPLLSVALLKNRDAFNNKIEKLIKEKFTALQAPVEWKFAEVAWDYLRNNGNEACTSNVGFDNVYPLYGAIDIRNSSQERSHAIQKDLKEHLILMDDTLNQLESILKLPLLEGLKFKNHRIKQSIEETMTAEDEIHVHEFLENEAEPVFNHLQKSNQQSQKIIENYFKTIRDSNSGLYRFRREYEETLSNINDTVLCYLEKEEETIQSSYPHYFEKYRTDGVEYNIYIGQSIAPNHPFDLLYLKNIRLWQLKSMAEVARITHSLLPSLKVPLQTTQLILIHSQCISINFRRDERRFDVEGSYNIRYEIMKKRLDKVRVKETEERLTQPNKIAMVYSNQKDVPEYQQYIEFLQDKKILEPGIEFLELEELQGVKGLKAIRVGIKLDEA